MESLTSDATALDSLTHRRDRLHRWFSIDPRTVLPLIICFNIVALGNNPTPLVCSAAVITLVYLSSAVRLKVTLGWVGFFLLNAGLLATPMVWQNWLIVTISFIAFWMMRFSITVGLAIYVFATIRPPEVAAVLTKSRAPEWIYVPLLVIFRFFPTAIDEVRAINEAMVLRGLRPGFWGSMLHPLKTGEYLIVPFLACSARIADELAQSAIIKGLGSKGEKSTIFNPRFGPGDLISLLLMITLITLWAAWPWIAA